MIIIYHNIDKVISVQDKLNATDIEFDTSYSVSQILFSMAKTYPNRLIVWAHQKIEKSIAFELFEIIFHHDAIIASYSTSQNFSIPDSIGYVEQSPFIKIKAEVCYPTWIMSSTIGGAKGEILNKFDYLNNYKFSFPILLNHISKKAQKIGVLCYSDPRLLKDNTIIINENKSNIFRFIKQHYKYRWLFILLVNMMFYEKRLPLINFFKAIISKKIRHPKIDISDVHIKSNINPPEFTIDVIIPTIGRKPYLKNVLLDLSKQTLLPQSVIIIEQSQHGISELDYLNDNWPFEIKHQCVSQFGACNARNLALQEVTANWVFFADDDIRLEQYTLNEIVKFICKYGINALSVSCLQKDETSQDNFICQSENFGSGTSIVNYDAIRGCFFKKEHELGYGEDIDFGMQLRNTGTDVIFNPKIRMLHLKAPIGGFRTKLPLLWEEAQIQPKPSPMVMAFKLKHYTNAQLLGYKTILFFKFYKRQQIRNPLRYLNTMNKRWRMSIIWAKQLMSYDI